MCMERTYTFGFVGRHSFRAKGWLTVVLYKCVIAFILIIIVIISQLVRRGCLCVRMIASRIIYVR